MSILNQGRNEIRFNNSSGKCLLENWVEERAVAHLDEVSQEENITSSAQKFRSGHGGILTTEFNAGAEQLTTVRESYRPPDRSKVRQVGKKQELLEQMLLEQVSKEVFGSELSPNPPEPTDFKSVTGGDFIVEGFVHKKPEPTKAHNYKNEQPVTFWSEHKDKIHSVSQVKTGDTPFRKNDAFSQPIDEYWNEPKPHDFEKYPKM
ncbi:hypothetical protein ScPMuIL_017688 [Solemya velum]